MEKIVFILGSGRCGSTVLDKFLGSHEEVFSGGELGNYTPEVKNDSLCSCTSNLSACAFHSELFKTFKKNNLSSQLHIKRRNSISTVFNLFTIITSLLFRLDFLTKKTSKELGINEKIIDYINSKTNKSVLVDSTKITIRALLLDRIKLKKKKKCFYILLVKNPLDVMVSKVKADKTVLNIKGQKTILKKTNQIPLKQAIASWNNSNLLSLLLLKLFVSRKNYTIILTEHFTADPEGTFNKINKVLGIGPFKQSMLNLNNHEHHLMGGNASRINATEIHKKKINISDYLDPSEIELIENKTKLVFSWLKRNDT